MMKSRFWLPALLLLLVSVAAPAQKKEFEKAVKAGREPGRYYVADLSKKEYTKEDVLSFAKLNGYVCQSIKEDVIVIYGARKRVAISVEFLPSGEDLGAPKTKATASASTAATSAKAVASPNAKNILAIVEKAVKKGIDPALGCYKASFPESTTYYTVATVQETMKANGYYIKSVKSGNREQVNEVLFVPQDKFPEAIYATYYPKGVEFSRLKRGTAWFPDKDMAFFNAGDIYWSGPVSGGMISGDGYGFQFISQDQVRIIKGVFENGKLTGNSYFRETNVDNIFREKWRQSDPGYFYDIQVLSRASSGYSWFNLKKKDKYKLAGLIDNNLNILRFSDFYDEYEDAELVSDFDAKGESVLRMYVVSGSAYIFSMVSTVDCVVNRQGKIYFSEPERQKILAELDDAVSHWDLICDCFKKSFTTGYPYREIVERFRNHQTIYWPPVPLANTIDMNGKAYRQFLAMEDLLVLSKAANANVEINESDIKEKIHFNIFGVVTNPYVTDYIDKYYMVKKIDAAKQSISNLRNNPVFDVPGMESSFESVLKRADENERRFQDNIAYVQSQLPIWIAQVAKKENAEQVVRMADIDEENSFPPHGELDYFDFGGKYTFRDKGRITLKNGDYLEYNSVYDKYDGFEFHTVYYSSRQLKSQKVSKMDKTNFTSYSQMANELIEASREERLKEVR